MMAGEEIHGGGLLRDRGGLTPPSVVFSSPLHNPRCLFPALMPGETPRVLADQATGGKEEEAKSGVEKGEAAVGGDDTSFGGRVSVPGMSRGSIAERRAAKSGFNAARLNTARFRMASPFSSPVARSPYITIPPGLSPATLLDSPVMLLNSLVQPSPTTGTLYGLSIWDQSSVPDLDKDRQFDDIQSSSLVSKPDINTSYTCLNNSKNLVSSNSTEIAKHLDAMHSPCETQRKIQPSVGDVENRAALAIVERESTNDSVHGVEVSIDAAENANLVGLPATPLGIGHTSRQECQLHSRDSGDRFLLEDEIKDASASEELVRLPEDGYKWRKYGQKQVKSRDSPCSYYKCTYPNCEVKKKVERSHNGHISEVKYNGTHDHPKPQMNCVSAIGSVFAPNEITEIHKSPVSLVNVEGVSVWRSVQQQRHLRDVSNSNGKYNGIERTSSTSVVTDILDPSSSADNKDMDQMELMTDIPAFSSNMGCDRDEEEGDRGDGGTEGSLSLGEDGDTNESDSKRRKRDGLASVTETNLSSRAAREPRVVVQTTSDVDVLDDGYRWRKYGQKVVKGNPNPRSYYKCTYPGCPVRKHVERACNDIKSVMTTYEGKHNHEVPAARNNSHHGIYGSRNLVLPQCSAQSSSSTSTKLLDVSKLHSTLHGFTPPFESGEYPKPEAYARNLNGDLKVVMSGTYASVAMNRSNIGLHSLVSLDLASSKFPGTFQMGMQSSGAGNLVFPMDSSSNLQYLHIHQNKEVDTGLLKAKEEQNEYSLDEKDSTSADYRIK